MDKPSYYAILPANVRYDKVLSPNAKLLYAEITTLLNMRGKCFASNEYFSRLYEISEVQVSRLIKQLTESGYLFSSVEKTATGSRRLLSITSFLPLIKNDNTPIIKNDEGGVNKNVKHINTIVINTSLSDDKEHVPIEGDLNSLAVSIPPKSKAPRKRNVGEFHQFEESKYYDFDYLSKRLSTDPDFKHANFLYYYRCAQVWSDGGNNQKNWLSTIHRFMLRDIRDKKLVTNEQKETLSGVTDLTQYLQNRYS